MKLCNLSQLRKTAIFTLLFGIFIFLCEVFHLKTGVCNQKESLRQLRLLCAQYQRGENFGNMCPSLCDVTALRFTSCVGDNVGKSVILMECDGCITEGKTSKIILKLIHVYDLENWQSIISSRWGRSTKLSEKISMTNYEIRAHCKANLDKDFNHTVDIISLMIGEDFNTTVKRLDSAKATETVLIKALALVSQPEFLSYKVLGSNTVFPTLYGTCGPTYFVENTPSLSSLNYVLFRGKKQDILSMKWNFPSWSLRVKAALSILKMVREIEDSYDTVLQHCDIQPHNFGVSDEGEVVIIDSDTLKFGHVFDHLPPCKSDSDCTITTCSGICNRTTQRCIPEMTTTNLQIVCKNIFVSHIGFLGLLRKAPTKIEGLLKEALHRCIHPKEIKLRLPKENKSDRKMLAELEMLLKSTL